VIAGGAFATVAAQTLRMALPYACAGLGGVWSERSGVVNIALEGGLLAGALAASAIELQTTSPCAGLAAGILGGAAVGAAHAVLVERWRVDAIVSGLGLNLVCAGGTRFLTRALYGSSSNSPAIEGFRALTGHGPLVRAMFDPLTLLTAASVLGTAWALRSTRLGLRVRACGESVAAATASEVDVGRTRIQAVSLGGAIVGLGGAALAQDAHGFQSGMSGGRGFIALAIMILASLRPGRTALACVAFAALDVLQVGAQGYSRGLGQLAQGLPYAAALLALWLAASRKRAAA
jgi:simple sugar transport system permease protein